MSEWIDRSFVIPNRLGLHARAAAQLVHLANRYASEVRIGKDGMEVNGKSIMGVLMLAAPRGATVVIHLCGPDSADLMTAIAELIDRKFGEE